MAAPVTIRAAAAALGVSQQTIRRWIAAGAPVAQQGRVGRGHATLVSIPKLVAFRAACTTTSRQAPDSGVAEALAEALWAAFREIESPCKRDVAPVLAAAWYFTVISLGEEPQIIPEKVTRLRSI